MAALTGNLACETEGFMIRGNDTKTRPQLLAEDAYDIADAMLAAREPKPVDKDPADCAPPLDHGQATDRGNRDDLRLQVAMRRVRSASGRTSIRS